MPDDGMSLEEMAVSLDKALDNYKQNAKHISSPALSKFDITTRATFSGKTWKECKAILDTWPLDRLQNLRNGVRMMHENETAMNRDNPERMKEEPFKGMLSGSFVDWGVFQCFIEQYLNPIFIRGTKKSK